MSSDFLKVPKSLRSVVLWVHPEGRVFGSLYLHTQSKEHAGEEDPFELLNEDQPFLIVRRDDPEELRFYNRAAIVRLEYRQAPVELTEVRPFPCRLHLMDGSVLTGMVNESLPPDRSRLVDYLNQRDVRFLRLQIDDDHICLVNKSYIIHAADLGDGDDPNDA